MASGDATPFPKKNVAYRVTFPIFDNDGDLVTGATALDSEVSLDGGTFSDVTAEATEIATSSGMYFLDLTQAEMNADTVAIIIKTSTGDAKTTPIVLYPEEAGDIRVNVTQISDDATAANNLELDYDGTGFAKANSTIGTTTTNTDMVGTNSAALASVCTEGRLAELDGANLPTDVAAVKTDTAAVLVDTADMQPKIGAPAGASVSADIAAVKSETALIVADTNELQVDDVPGLISALNDPTVTSIRSLVSGTADSGSTTTLVDAVRTEGDTDYWVGCWLLITSGTAVNQVRLITAFTPGTDTLTVAPAFTQAIATNTYEILPAGAITSVQGDVTGNVDGNVTGSVGSLTGHTVQTGDSFARIGAPAGASVSADVADVPTVAEFNARTIVAANYFDPAADTVANVSTVATLTNHTAQTGDSFARLAAPAGASVSADIAAVKVDTAATLVDTADIQPKIGTPSADLAADVAAVKSETALIVADTNELQTDDVPGLIAALNDLSAVQVNTEIDSALIDAGIVLQVTTIATLASQTSFTLSAGSVDNSAYNGCWAIITDVSTATQKAIGYISAYTGATKTVTLIVDPAIFTMAATDKIAIVSRKFVDLLAATQTSIDAIETDTADIQPKIGTPSADLAADVAAVKSETASILADTGTTLDTKLNDIQGGTFSSATDSLEAIRDRGDAAWTTGSGANPTTLQNTTITGLVSQTVFNLTAGSDDADAYNGCIVVVEDSATSTQKAVGVVVDYSGSPNRTITLLNDPGIFVMANGDTVDVIADRSVKPATDNRTLAVSASGEVSLLAATQTSIDAIETDTADMQPKIGVPSADLAADIAAVKVDTAATLVDTADMQPKIGVPSADLSADIAAVKAETASILTDTGATLDTKLNDIQGGTFSSGTDSLEAIRDRGDAAWTTGAGGSDRLLMVDTTIATLASQTSFTLTAGSADDDAYNNCTIIIEDVSTATQKAIGIVSDYTGSTKTITLLNDPSIFTMAATDKIYVLAEKGLKPTIDNRTLAVSASGEVSLLAATQTSIDAIETDTADMQPKLGSPSADLAADIAAVKVDTAATLVDTADMQPKLGSPSADLAADIAAVKVDTAATLVDTADMQPKLGSPSADLAADIAAVKAETALIVADTSELQTDDIPGTIAALNDISTAQVNTEVDTALSDINLDHLLKVAVIGTDVIDNSVLAKLVSKSATADWDNFVNTTDSLQAQRDNIGSAVGADISADVAAVKTETALIVADTNELQTDDIPGLIAALNNISTADVNAQVLDVLVTDTFAQIGQEAPAATQSFLKMMQYLYKAWRNKSTQTATEYDLYNDDTSTVDQKATVSDDATTFSRLEVVTGP